ncbi:hypothetical protein [Saccharopolyspora phatthalungensis]|nr:hypothetical protein [Saccharopolyspora phatthalungensis]MBB5154034.1 hypothetical protein [Saccharopolyspora phatthalungensis]
MQVQALNKRAMNKYQELHNALEVVRIALQEAARLHAKIRKPVDEDSGWRVPDREQVEAGHHKATEQLNVLHTSTVKWEKELVSRGWRV